MMLSVLKHTTHPVKFWFLENYLFKNFIPHMAEHYGFQYDVLFPLSVKHIIFVDADPVQRLNTDFYIWGWNGVLIEK